MFVVSRTGLLDEDDLIDADIGICLTMVVDLIALEVAPILCAGVTVYKGLKVTDTRPGQWVAISGIGGSATSRCNTRAMGLRVVAVDIDDTKLALATRLGAEVAVNARTADVVAEVRRLPAGYTGAGHRGAPASLRAGDRAGAPGRHDHVQRAAPGRVPGTDLRHRPQGADHPRIDCRHPPDMTEALDFYARGLIHPTVHSARLEDINDIFTGWSPVRSTVRLSSTAASTTCRRRSVACDSCVRCRGCGSCRSATASRSWGRSGSGSSRRLLSGLPSMWSSIEHQ